MILRTSCVFALCTFMGACALQPKSMPPQVSSSAYRVRREALLLSRDSSIKAGDDGGSALALRCIALQKVTARPDFNRGPNES